MYLTSWRGWCIYMQQCMHVHRDGHQGNAASLRRKERRSMVAAHPRAMHVPKLPPLRSVPCHCCRHACCTRSRVTAVGMHVVHAAVSLLSACMLYTQHIRRPPRIPQSCPNRSSAIVHHCMHPHSSILREAYRMHVERFVVHSRRAPRLPFLRHVGSTMPCMHNSCPRCTDVARMHGVHV